MQRLVYTPAVDLVYLDNNATTRPAPEVCAAMDEVNRELWGNPSSVHRFGQRVRQRVELARQQVAHLLGCKPVEVVFTSGGTESNNLAIHGLLTPKPGQQCTLITNRVEHSAVREPAEDLDRLAESAQVLWMPVDGDGVVDVAALPGLLERSEGKTLVSVQWANNETGTIQPIAELAETVKRFNADAEPPRRVWLHIDATQAAGKTAIDLADVAVDLLTIASHKFHGPKGMGALFVRRGVRLRPTQRGGPQEMDRRGGTENTPGIIGMGVAAELAWAFLKEGEAVERVRALRDRLESEVSAELPDTVVNAASAEFGRLWNTSNLGFPGLEAEAILLGLSERGVCASAGAACSSGSLEPSPVLLAMGIPERVAHGSVRSSLSRCTTQTEVDAAVRHLVPVVQRLRQAMPT